MGWSLSAYCQECPSGRIVFSWDQMNPWLLLKTLASACARLAPNLCRQVCTRLVFKVFSGYILLKDKKQTNKSIIYICKISFSRSGKTSLGHLPHFPPGGMEETSNCLFMRQHWFSRECNTLKESTQRIVVIRKILALIIQAPGMNACIKS